MIFLFQFHQIKRDDIIEIDCTFITIHTDHIDEFVRMSITKIFLSKCYVTGIVCIIKLIIKYKLFLFSFYFFSLL